jgi:octaprenyl-diphosphate synthase
MQLSNGKPLAEATGVMERLGDLCLRRGLDGLATRLAALQRFAGEDVAACEADLAAIHRGGSAVERSAAHLLDLGGKRLRPLCVALAARAGSGFGPAARELAVAVELVHAATLLHDDVVDLGEARRGAPAARLVYGNAASIFAGDWLLVEALRRVRRAEVPGALDRLLDVIEEMILAESIQLERRGRLVADRRSWLRVVEGKTAALFRWAMFAGGRAGGLDEERCLALEAYGLHLGVAFQAIDDVLDLAGDAAATGKAVFADVREGKMTWPLIVAIEREPAVRGLLEEVIATPVEAPLPDRLVARVREAVERTGGLEDCRALARARAAEATRSLARLPASEARAALEIVAEAAVGRSR